MYLAETSSGNRYGMHKGSAHKSNSVHLVVDMERSLFCQCHDPDCRGWRSESELPTSSHAECMEEASARPLQSGGAACARAPTVLQATVFWFEALSREDRQIKTL